MFGLTQPFQSQITVNSSQIGLGFTAEYLIFSRISSGDLISVLNSVAKMEKIWHVFSKSCWCFLSKTCVDFIFQPRLRSIPTCIQGVSQGLDSCAYSSLKGVLYIGRYQRLRLGKLVGLTHLFLLQNLKLYRNLTLLDSLIVDL